MKESLFNSIIPLGNNRILVYNSLSDKFLVIRNAKEFKGLKDLYNSSTSEAEKLIGIGAFVGKGTDEVRSVNNIIEKVDKDSSLFVLHINPTLDCNFRCWYCYEEHREGSMMNDSSIANVRRFIANTINENLELKEFHLAFFGGEPLLGYDSVVKPLVIAASEKAEESGLNFSISFTSNGYLITPEIVDFLKQFDCFFQITLDGGEDAHNKVRYTKGGGESFRQIIENIKKLAKAGIRCVCRVNYTSDNVYSTESIFDAVNGLDEGFKRNISIDFQRVWQDRPVSEFESQRDIEIDDFVRTQLNKYAKAGFLVSFHKPLGGIWDSCYADKKNHVLVNYNGDVFCCTARDFETGNRSGYLNEMGKIEWDSEYMEKRLNCKFIKEICHKCRIAPLCGGGCRQQAMEHYDSDKCIYGYSEQDKDNIVLNRFENFFVK